MKGIVAVDAPAPEFTLPTDDGGSVTLAELRGRKVALFFYPKADTAGCTREAMDFHRLRGRFAKADTVILGVSADPVSAQEKFKAKHGLALQLASDPTHRMLRAYGVWGAKVLYGRRFKGIHRTTYLIDREGRVARVWERVRVEGHASEVLAAAEAL
jgi:peroxiredoxin Q/BCP